MEGNKNKTKVCAHRFRKVKQLKSYSVKKEEFLYKCTKCGHPQIRTFILK